MDRTRLNRRRGNLKAQITRLKSFIENLEQSDCIVIETKLDSVLKIRTNLELLKEEFYSILQDEELPETEECFLQLDEEAEYIQVSLKRFLSKLDEKITDNCKEKTKLSEIRLPEIPLPTFSGKFEEWNVFYEQFVSLIENNQALSSKQKLYYLKSALIGKAKAIQTTEDSYESLLSALQHRFDNKRLICFSHINELLTLDKIKTESARELRILIDQLMIHLRALKQMELIPNHLTELLLISIVSQKLDIETRKNYEMTLTSNDLPKWDNFIEYLEKRCQILENLKVKDLKYSINKLQSNVNKSKSFLINSNSSCVICKKSHMIYNCSEFQKFDVKKRFDLAKKYNLCLNCLNSSHRVSNCKSKYCCSICSRRHHSLLHDENKAKPINTNAGVEVEQNHMATSLAPSDVSESVCANVINTPNGKGIIPTIVVMVKNAFGKWIKCRAILDSGSESNYITTEFCDLLNLKKLKIDSSVSGINTFSIKVKNKVVTDISNITEEFIRTVELFAVPRITGILPSKKIYFPNTKLPSNISLADPNFDVPGKIDILLGAEIFFNALRSDKLNLENSQFILQDTVFGYIVSGTVSHINLENSHSFLLKQPDEDINDTLKRFWELEEISEIKSIKGKEDQICEEHFLKTHYREKSGRYVVQMPLKMEPTCLGNSKFSAISSLNRQWKKLAKNTELLNLYRNFLKDYLEMGHMEEIEEDTEPEVAFYLPHHGVFRPDSISTPLRVVFNASSVTTSGESLNSLQYTGGVIQEDLYSILLRFRKHKYAYSADIQKMFRMISIDRSQRDLLRILWKNNIDEPIKTYRLTTVTYGLTSSPFLATRTLKQLAIDEGSEFSLASPIIMSDVYMDDILSGSEELETAQRAQSQLKSLLEKASMHLHKWTSNSDKLLNSSSGQTQHLSFPSHQKLSTKTLGLNWNPRKDTFFFKVDIQESSVFTKREVLSVIARLYDPLGLLGPVISKAKIFMQGLWLHKLNWEDTLPTNLAAEWKYFVTSLKSIDNLRIPRWILTNNMQEIVLCCFADASEKAYGAVIYVQCMLRNGSTTTKLVTSKSRVAPLKTISIPRLELCACLMVSLLAQKVQQSLKMKIDNTMMFTDSSISLAWIKTPPHQLKGFVATRVAKIQTLTENCSWNHVPTDQNPADIISRGVYPDQLASLNDWWNGPSFLKNPVASINENINDAKQHPAYLTELKRTKDLSLMVTENNFIVELLNLSNNYCKLINVLSYIFRFFYNCKTKLRKVGPLETEEVAHAEKRLIVLVQRDSFPDEHRLLSNKLPVAEKSNLKSFNPFVDNWGMIRVGGRLREANLPYDSTHPIILPRAHRLSILVMLHYHHKYFHMASQALLNCSRQKFWIIGGRNLARRLIYGCVTCAKAKPRFINQIMGDLPAERLTTSFPFHHTGIDFAGPFFIKYKGQRKGSLNKIYIALFICFTTRAVHLEIVSDLTSESFIASLKRFISRRGICSTIFTDNAKNFVGANNDLKRLYNLVNQPDKVIANYLRSERISWKFIPPKAPHFGGLWEGGIKSVKYHLKRIMSSSNFTYEEFLTIINEIEGILNSRPLSPLSSDANDLNVLTPAHFLIGRPMTTLVEPDVSDLKDSNLSRWQRTTKVTQYLWKRWYRECINHLQQRSKWYFARENIKIGTLVLIKEDNLPPNVWPIGRISELVYGKDHRVRVCILKTKSGLIKRPLTKLAILPINPI